MLKRSRLRALVLDDDTSMQRLIAALLRRAGYRVDITSKGLQAIHALEKTAYDAVLLDVMMPTEGGMTVVKHLREHDPDLLKRVLLVTSTPDSALRSVRPHVAGVVRKPFTEDALLSSVSRMRERAAQSGA